MRVKKVLLYASLTSIISTIMFLSVYNIGYKRGIDSSHAYVKQATTIMHEEIKKLKKCCNAVNP